MPNLITVAMVRNESKRFWRSALEAWSDFSDQIIVLDDNSTDATPDIAREYGAIVAPRFGDPAWGQESGPRQQLWHMAIANTSPGDWIIFSDADQVPARSPRQLMQTEHSTAFSFLLFDMWDDRRYREDQYWRGHLNYRVWMIQRPEPQDWVWSDRGIHCGHLPQNFVVERSCGAAPYDMSIVHYGYSNPRLRTEAYTRYMAQRHQLTDHERKHAESIMDPNPRILPLHFQPDYRLKYEGTDLAA